MINVFLRHEQVCRKDERFKNEKDKKAITKLIKNPVESLRMFLQTEIKSHALLFFFLVKKYIVS
jgi:hypothetical protein